ncbi:MAG: tetratricopeptide repeat protein [Candidatus Poribacteria bacterium]|nr:tetratricopeptide repeat protein [Candidatus Poribacteria bacterium]
MIANETQDQEHQPIEETDTDSNENQDGESAEDSDAEQVPINKTFRIGCMTFCLAAFVLFLWVWHHQTQFNDNYRKASFHMRNDEPEQAIEAYQKAIKNKGRTIFFTKAPSAYNNLGHAYLSAERYSQAIATFKKAIQMAPDISEGYVNLASVYLQKNEPANARAICLDALQTFPKAPLLHYNLACAYALTNEPQKSLNSLRQAVEIDPELSNFAEREDALKHIVPKLP